NQNKTDPVGQTIQGGKIKLFSGVKSTLAAGVIRAWVFQTDIRKMENVEIRAMAPERASMRMLPYMEQGVIIGGIRFLAPMGLNKRIVT
ncbi:hypothetical protein, partial [Muribaculum intestinale]|uniref:hypothetical protein n=1 Tax=Muribaculum intestinale TaxID=1796646 RepID=UPI002432CE2C